MEKMMMPAYYNVLSTEEMTYTEGGATATMSEALLCWLIPPYGWFKGVTAVRDYRRKNPLGWRRVWMLWLLIWRRALPTPSATSPALHGSSLQPLLVSVWSSTQRSSCSDPSYLIRPARSTPKNKAGGGAARKGSASAVFVLILPAKDLLPKVLHLFCQTAHSDSPCGHRVLGRP